MTLRFTVFVLMTLIHGIVRPAISRPLVVGNEQPLRIVITNDDGVEDLEDRLIPLAKALIPFAETYIVIPSQDRSGSTNFTSIGKHQRALESELIYVKEKTKDSERLEIHVVEGFPADCVSLAVGGILRDRPPDVLISGINSGPNLGEAWIGSGTIGAARMAAYYGIPALSISGINDNLEGAVEAVTEWVARLARSQLILNLEPGQYLTVGLPRGEPSKIKGIRIAPRAPRLGSGYFEPTQKLRDEEKWTVWLGQAPLEAAIPPADTDMALYAKDYIVITPMRVDEHDYPMLKKLGDSLGVIPAWKSTHGK